MMKFLNKNIKIIISVLLLFSFFSCNLFKKNIKNKENTDKKEIAEIQKKISDNNLQFKTFTATFSGSYKDNKQQLPLKGIMKIKKDSVIWLTIRPFLGIEIARILLTTDSIKYIDKIKNQYFEENYNYLNKKFGFNISYKLIEALFTNKLVTYPAEEKLINYELEINETNFILRNEKNENGKIFIHILSGNKKYKLIENRLFLKDKSKSISVYYKNFKTINEKQFPSEINIDTKNKQQLSKTIINLKNIKIDNNLNIKFAVPKNYKRIKFD